MAKTPFISRLLSRLPGVQHGFAEKAKNHPLPDLKMIFFIFDWQYVNVAADVFAAEKVRFHFTTMARGFPNSEVLDLLGIGTEGVALVTCLEQAVGVPVLMKEMRNKLSKHSNGAGIAFSVPLSAINEPVLLIFKQSIHKNENVASTLKEGSNTGSAKEGGNMAEKTNHDLIISIVNQGYSDDFMNTARAAGASGGTVLNARGQAHEGAVKFFGISVQEEKEIILILSPREKKVSIMKAVCDNHGLNSKAQGIVFSLPVDNVMGLNFE